MRNTKLIKTWKTELKMQLRYSLPILNGKPVPIPDIEECPDFQTLVDRIYSSVNLETCFYYRNTCFCKFYHFENEYFVIVGEKPLIKIDFQPYINLRTVERVLPIISPGLNTTPLSTVIKPYPMNMSKLTRARELYFERIHCYMNDYPVFKRCSTLLELKTKLFREAWHCDDTFIYWNLAFMNTRWYAPLWYVIKDGEHIGTFDLTPFKEINKQEDIFNMLMEDHLDIYPIIKMPNGNDMSCKSGGKTYRLQRLSEDRFNIHDESSGDVIKGVNLFEVSLLVSGEKKLEDLHGF